MSSSFILRRELPSGNFPVGSWEVGSWEVGWAEKIHTLEGFFLQFLQFASIYYSIFGWTDTGYKMHCILPEMTPCKIFYLLYFVCCKNCAGGNFVKNESCRCRNLRG